MDAMNELTCMTLFVSGTLIMCLSFVSSYFQYFHYIGLPMMIFAATYMILSRLVE